MDDKTKPVRDGLEEFLSNPTPKKTLTDEQAFEKVDAPCEVCGARPVVRATGLCGPCTFGEAETAGGNW
jgi:hypothetical protein